MRRLKNVLYGILLLIAIAGLIGCGTPIDSANFDKITVGMHKEQVIGILGKPNDTSSINVAGISGEAATWKRSAGVINIQFANDKVRAKQAKLHGR
jgi:SmpA / OmlA family